MLPETTKAELVVDPGLVTLPLPDPEALVAGVAVVLQAVMSPEVMFLDMSIVSPLFIVLFISVPLAPGVVAGTLPIWTPFDTHPEQVALPADRLEQVYTSVSVRHVYEEADDLPMYLVQVTFSGLGWAARPFSTSSLVAFPEGLQTQPEAAIPPVQPLVHTRSGRELQVDFSGIVESNSKH